MFIRIFENLITTVFFILIMAHQRKLYILIFSFGFIFLFFGLPLVLQNKENKEIKLLSPKPKVLLKENPLGATQKMKAEWLDSVFEGLNNSNRINGCVLYAEGEQVVFKHSFGWSDFSKKDFLSTSTPFQLASVSKVITATAVLMLSDKGQIDIHKDIRTYLPEIEYSGITVENLLEHRSGIPNYVYVAENYWNKSRPFHNCDIIPLFKENHIKPSFTPGKRYQYSNTNYALLALLVERVSKMPFASFLEKNIFMPSGMKHSFVLNIKDSTQWQEVAKGYMPMGKGYKLQEWDYLDGVSGDKDTFSSVEDLFLFANALDKGVLLKKSTYQQACTPILDKAHLKKSNYGMGWRIREIAGQKIVYHNGWWRGYKSFFIRLPEKKISLIVLCNRTNVHLNGLLYDMLLYPDKEKENNSKNNQEEEEKEQSSI